jgi:hypothetical protein
MTASVGPLLLPGQVLLPSELGRTVLQDWKVIVPPAPVYRSIEMAGGAYYMVSRVIDDDGRIRGGEIGMLLDRRSFCEYALSNGNGIFRISETGTLLGYSDDESEPHMICEPVQGLPK